MKYFLHLIIFTCIWSIQNDIKLLAQDPAVVWDKTIGGFHTDYLQDCEVTTDGGFIMAGYTNSEISGDKTENNIGGLDYWIVKLNAFGNIEWQQTLGTVLDDRAIAIAEASDGGFLVGGYTFGGVSGDKTEAAIGGYDYWIVKLSSTGTIVWQQTIGGNANDYLTDILNVPGGFVLSGYSQSGISGDKTSTNKGGSDYWVMKINNTGSILWQFGYGGTGEDDLAKTFRNAAGNYILGGTSSSGISGDKNVANNGYADIWIFEIDGAGNIVWQKDIGGDLGDAFVQLIQLESGDYVIAANTNSNQAAQKRILNLKDADSDEWGEYDIATRSDFWIIKINNAGDIIWEKNYGEFDGESAVSLFQYEENKITIVGNKMEWSYFTEEYFTITVDTNGYMLRKDEISGLAVVDEYDDEYYDNEINHLVAGGFLPDNGFFLAGYSNGLAGVDKSQNPWGPAMSATDYWIVKLAPDTASTFPTYTDFDGDGFGADSVALVNEDVMKQYVLNNYDCDDKFADVYDGALEICDGKDNNCNGTIDEGLIGCNISPDMVWDKTIGGNNYDDAKYIASNPDGTFIVGGSTTSITGDFTENKGAVDCSIAKLGADGAVLWTKIIGGAGDDKLKSIEPTTDGGYIMAAFSTSGISGDKSEANIGLGDYWIVKLDEYGTIVWQNTIGGTLADIPKIARQTIDGGYIIGGNSASYINGDKTETSYGNHDYWVIKLNDIGNIEWQNSIGGSSADSLADIQQLPDGTFIVGGSSTSSVTGEKTVPGYGAYDYWMLKLNTTGTVLWQKATGGLNDDFLKTMLPTPDNGFFAVGNSKSPVGPNKSVASLGIDYWVVKYDSLGSVVWEKTIQGNLEDICIDAIVTPSGEVVIGGTSNSIIGYNKSQASTKESFYTDNAFYFMEDGLFDLWLVKLDEAGNYIWQKTIGGNMDDYLAGLSISPLGNIMITATSGSFKSAYKSENQKGFIKCITHVESFSDPACFVDKDFWTLKLAAEYCVPTPELCNTLDDNCNGLIDDDVVETINITAAGPTEFCQGGSVSLSATYSGTSLQWQKNGVDIPGATLASYTAATKGNYACVTTSDCGSAISETIFINVFKNPKAIISAAGPTTFCVGGNVTLNVSPVAGCSYQWYKDASPIPGATATNYLATTAGIYKCRVTKIVTGCYKTSSGITVNVPCKEGLSDDAAGEVITDKQILVYPNPTDEIVFIELPGNTNALIKIYNNLGQQVQQQTCYNEMAEIVVQQLPAGIYFIELQHYNTNQTLSFCKQ